MAGSAPLSVDQSLWAIERGRLARAIASLRFHADAGETEAYHPLAYLYDTGQGTRRNRREALKWYRRGYRAGSSISTMNIATIYRDARKPRLEYAWYLRAADMGDGDAYVEVASRLINGRGVRRDVGRARRYLTKARLTRYITEAGRNEAARLLGGLHV